MLSLKVKKYFINQVWFKNFKLNNNFYQKAENSIKNNVNN